MDARIRENNVMKSYLDDNVPDEMGNYTYLLNGLNNEFTSYSNSNIKNYILKKNVTENITAIVDILGDQYSTSIHQESLDETFFINEIYKGFYFSRKRTFSR